MERFLKVAHGLLIIKCSWYKQGMMAGNVKFDSVAIWIQI